MIGRLTGRVLECGPGELLLDVGGVGYALQIAVTTYYELSARAESAVSLHVHTHVREDALQLYGFLLADDKQLFELLITISGVGPKLALAILSGIGGDELRQTVAGQDRQRLQKIPGVGKKTAERLLLELRDKIKPAAPTGGAPDEPAEVQARGKGEAIHDLRGDAVSALVNLGYSQDASARAVDGALARRGGEGSSLQDLLKAALGGLLR